MNKHGFISIYALVLLFICLAFTTMFIQSIKTFVTSHTYDLYELIDVHIIQQIKRELSQKETMDEKPKVIVKNQKNETNDKIKASTYKGCLIQYAYNENTVFVQYSCNHTARNIKVTYDSQKKIILQYTYLKEK